MGHFAKLDENNVVLQVVVIANEDFTVDDVEEEALGIAYCKYLYGEDTNWAQTSYNGNFRKQYAGIGFTLDESKDLYITKPPFDSWRNDSQGDWQPPVGKEKPFDVGPRENNTIFREYTWDENSLTWIVDDFPNPAV